MFYKSINGNLNKLYMVAIQHFMGWVFLRALSEAIVLLEGIRIWTWNAPIQSSSMHRNDAGKQLFLEIINLFLMKKETIF